MCYSTLKALDKANCIWHIICRKEMVKMISTTEEMTNFTFKMDRKTRESYSALCEAFGLSMSAATLALVRQAVRSHTLLTSRATLKKVNKLLKDIMRNGYDCSYGKVEMLKGDFSGFASVRIDKKNRIIFSVDDNKVTVIQCGGHYDDK